MKTFRIITRGGIGDALLLTPTVRSIKRQYPGSRLKLYCVTQPHFEIFMNNPYVDVLRMATFRAAPLAFLSFRLNPSRYSLPFFRHSYPTGDLTRHAARVFGEYCEIQVADYKLDIFLTGGEKSWARDFVSKYKNPVVIQVAAVASENKHWKEDNWRALISRNPQYTFLQLGSPREPRIEGSVDLCGRTTLRQSIAIVKYAESFVGVESVLGHATNAVGTPGVVLFGPTTPEKFGHPMNIALSVRAPCSPCITWRVPQPCMYETYCMSSISVADVERALESQVARRRADPAWRLSND